MITDKAIVRTAHVAKERIPMALVTAVSQTDRVAYLKRIGHPFEVLELAGYGHTEAGAVAANAVLLPPRSMITAAVVTVHSTPEQLAVAACKALVNGVVVEKAAAVAITFSAAHQILATKYGSILIQMNNAGAISTKVVAAIQSYATLGEAIANTPLADADKVAIARLDIQAKAGVDWDANTDDMTAASDLQTITITNVAAVAKVSAAGIAFASLSEIRATLQAAIGTRQAGRDDYLAVLYTSDGTGALTNGSVTVTIRPMKMGGDTRNE